MGDSRIGEPASEVLKLLKRGDLISIRQNRAAAEPLGVGEILFVAPLQHRLGLRCVGELSLEEALSEGDRVILDYCLNNAVYFLFAEVDEVVDLGHRAKTSLNLQVAPSALILPLRAHERYEVPARIRLMSEEGDPLVHYDRLVPLNISEGGFGLALPRRSVKVGNKVRFAFELMPDEVAQRKLRRFGEQVPRARIAGTAEVRRVVKRPAHTGDQLIYAGFKFLELTDPAPKEALAEPQLSAQPKERQNEEESCPQGTTQRVEAQGEVGGATKEGEAQPEVAQSAPSGIQMESVQLETGANGENAPAEGEVSSSGDKHSSEDGVLPLGEFLKVYAQLGEKLEMLERSYFERIKQQGG